MNKHYFTLVAEYQKHRNIKPQTNLSWSELLKSFAKILKINTCSIYVFGNEMSELEKKLKGMKYKKEKVSQNNFTYRLNVNDYISYIDKYENGELYRGPYEDPEFYTDGKLKIDTISHEYVIILHIDNNEKNMIEEILGIKLRNEMPKVYPKDAEPE